MSKETEVFTRITFGYSKETSVNVVRSNILKKMVGEDNDLNKESKVDLSHFPTCQDLLLIELHPARGPMLLYLGWSINKMRILEPVWTTGSIMPQSLIDLLGATNVEESNDE